MYWQQILPPYVSYNKLLRYTDRCDTFRKLDYLDDIVVHGEFLPNPPAKLQQKAEFTRVDFRHLIAPYAKNHDN